MAVMVLFRDRFRLVAPSSGTKFAHALIKYRLSQMSLHRIHHPTQKAVHDPRKAPLSSPRPKPTRALWLIFQLFAQFTCFPLASGWGILSIISMFGATFTFLLALLLLDSCCNFPAWSNFHFSTCFAPTGFLLQLPRLEQLLLFCLLCSYWIPAVDFPLGATFPFLLALLLLDSCCNFPAWSNFHFWLALLLLDSCCRFPAWSIFHFWLALLLLDPCCRFPAWSIFHPSQYVSLILQLTCFPLTSENARLVTRRLTDANCLSFI